MDDHTASLDEQSVDDVSENPTEPKQASEIPQRPDEEHLPQNQTGSEEEGSPESVPVEAMQEEESPDETGSPGEMQWYVLKVQSNREKSIRNTLLRRIKREKLEPYFGDIIIPTEKVAETKSGKKRITEVKLYPGYIMVQMILTDDTWYLVRDTSGVGDFTGAAGTPIPMEEEEVKRMLGDEEAVEAQPKKVKIDLTTGETVKIKEGGFESFEGTIDSIDETSGKITVLVEIFGRSTPVELEYWQVEKV